MSDSAVDENATVPFPGLDTGPPENCGEDLGAEPESEAPAAGPRPLTPEARARSEAIHGTPVTLGHFGTWLLAWPGLNAEMDGLRDHFYVRRALGGGIDFQHLAAAARKCLERNYEVEPYEAFVMLASIAHDQDAINALGNALLEAFFEPAPENDRSYTRWVLSGLEANGVDIERVAPERVQDVVRHLVGCGFMLPEHEFISAAEAAVKRNRLGVGRR